MRAWLAILLLAAAAVADDRVTAFVDVTVVPMDNEHVVPHQTVVVRGGRITHVGNVHETVLPKGAARIDGRGRFLMPGLADMHVHNWYEEEHLLFVANGVTSVRNLWGKRIHLIWRKEIADGKRLGPTLYTTGPILDGARPIWEGSEPVATVAEARAIVPRLKREGFHAIKVYNKLTPEVYTALVETAREFGMRVTGHVPYGVGLPAVLKARQDCIEHLDGYVGFRAIEDARIPGYVKQTVAAGTWNCVTLVVYEKFLPFAEAKKLYDRPEMRFVPPRLRVTWDPRRDFRLKDLRPSHLAYLRQRNAVRRGTTKMLHDAGARILLGTDSANPFVVAGWSVHEELALLVKAGLTPYEALACGTRRAGEYLDEPFGTVAARRRADLVLLEADPLADIKNAQRIAGVMVRGRWLDSAELEERLAALVASYERPKDRFKDLPALPAGEVVRYEIIWNDLVVGEERFVIVRNADGSGTIHAQQVNDAPWDTRVQLTKRFDSKGRARDFRYRVEGRDEPVARDVECSKDEGVLDGSGLLSDWVTVPPLLGEGTTEFAFREHGAKVESYPLRVQRDGERAFTVVAKRRDGDYTSKIVFDPDGIPHSFTTKLQQGTVATRRVK